jgi:DtxR family transcriptional regulator, Mn-dependent transcriptional regulator
MTETKKFPIPSAEQEDLEEALGLVWFKFEEGERKKSVLEPALKEAVSEGIYETLLNKGYAREEGDNLALTPDGEALARDITRRHRLAERLLSDVLNLDRANIDPNACQLEHILSPEVSRSICTLLGHPTECPHGSPIPAGDCCQKAERQVEALVVPLDKLAAGQEGTIAYLLLHDHPELHKLLSLGVVPGTRVHLHQTFPTFVVELGESQLALEENIAKKIYVRRA